MLGFDISTPTSLVHITYIHTGRHRRNLAGTIDRLGSVGLRAVRGEGGNWKPARKRRRQGRGEPRCKAPLCAGHVCSPCAWEGNPRDFGPPPAPATTAPVVSPLAPLHFHFLPALPTLNGLPARTPLSSRQVEAFIKSPYSPQRAPLVASAFQLSQPLLNTAGWDFLSCEVSQHLP